MWTRPKHLEYSTTPSTLYGPPHRRSTNLALHDTPRERATLLYGPSSNATLWTYATPSTRAMLLYGPTPLHAKEQRYVSKNDGPTLLKQVNRTSQRGSHQRSTNIVGIVASESLRHGQVPREWSTMGKVDLMNPLPSSIQRVQPFKHRCVQST